MATELDDEGAQEPGPAPASPRRTGRGRRGLVQIVAFIGVLCAGLLIGWVVFRDDEKGPGPTPETTPGVATDTRTFPRLGISLGLPTGWKTSFRGSVLTAVSRDETVSVALSDAGGPDAGRRVRRADRNELARLFKAGELSRQRANVGTASTVVTELVGRAKNRRPIRILSMGASSRFRTYSIQVFTVLRPANRRVAELRALLASVRYREPS